MGVVRREGDWRLEKQEDGVYLITYEKQPELKIITSDYEPSGFTDERDDFSLPIREVETYSDAESIFEGKTQGGNPPSTGGLDMGMPSMEAGETGDGLGEIDTDLGLDDDTAIPLGGIAFVGALAGGFAIQQAGLNVSSPIFLFGVALLLIPVVVGGLTVRAYQSGGLSAAFGVLLATANGEDDATAGESDADTEKTPPAPESMKDDIYFDRAEQKCEWCDERTDSPEVHHITPRSEGGPNEYENLIALCPGCHSKADKGGISRTKLRSKVSRRMDSWSKEA